LGEGYFHKMMPKRINISTVLSKGNKKIRALGVITGGGDCPGLNAAIRAVVRRADRSGVKVYGIREGFRGLYEGKISLLSPLDVSGIVSLGGTILGTSRFNPLRDKKSEAKIKNNLKKFKIQCLINIGGEGTMRLSNELHLRNIPTVGVPKTIDNDVWGTDFTFGFDTAVSIATEAIDRLHTTAESHSRVMIVEVMGRHAGWIATYAGIAGGADAILIPEQTFRLSHLLGIIRNREKLGKRFSIVVVSEDAKILLDVETKKSEMLHTPMHHDEYGNLKLGGISSLLERTLRRHLQMEVRSTILGYIQRGGSPTAYDRVLATRLGVAAVELALQGKSGRMVGLKGNKIRSLPFKQVVSKIKTVDRNIYQIGEIFFG
jgi:ATP-dependent phosphofructokinase / diphosphate-dependent phosphofructokinase